ncbi:Gfo/Idh/MocA family protein [Rhodococcus koreensis]
MTTTESSRQLKVAIAGHGMIGELHRRGALLAGAQLVGVLASTPERSRGAAARWDAGTGFADIGELVASDADVVHIATPNALHARYVEAALAAGKHVICEKPLGVSAEEATRLQELADASGVVATVPFIYRYHPLVREIRARVRTGEFGPWNLLHGHYLQDWMLSPGASSWRVDPAQGGPSRAFADIGSHWCDLVEWVSGETFDSVSAQLSIAHATRPAHAGRSFTPVEGFDAAAGNTDTVRTEDAAVLLLRTGSGVLGSVSVSQVAAGRKNRLWFELDGARASAVFDQENPEQIWIGTQEQSIVLNRDPTIGAAEQRRLSTLPAGHPQGYAQCFESFIADTYAAVRGGKPEGLPTFTSGARSARIVDAVLRSAVTKEWERI